MTSEKPS